MTGWAAALVIATSAHLGFQLTVTLVVYPALAATPVGMWTAVHRTHSRRIAPLVVVLYVGLLSTAAGTLLTVPSPASVVAAAAVGTVIGLTATLAGPLHVRLGQGPDEARMRRLLRVDRVRTATALVALAAAVLA